MPLQDIATRVVLTLLGAATVAYAALPVTRHAAGIVSIESATRDTTVPVPQAPVRDLSPIFEKAPFGRIASPDIPGVDSGRDLPQFTLKGVFAASGSTSAALIDVDGETDLFRETEDVTPAYVLFSVARDHVKLKGDETTLIVRFDQDIITEPEAEDQPANTAQDLIAQLGQSVVTPARYEQPKPPETTSEYIDYWRGRIRKNPKAVLDEIGLEPTEQGYVIAAQHDVGVRLAGLRSGDLVRSVNGQSVGNPDDDRAFYDRIAASGQARLEVERNGQVLTFSFPLR